MYHVGLCRDEEDGRLTIDIRIGGEEEAAVDENEEEEEEEEEEESQAERTRRRKERMSTVRPSCSATPT